MTLVEENPTASEHVDGAVDPSEIKDLYDTAVAEANAEPIPIAVKQQRQPSAQLTALRAEIDGEVPPAQPEQVTVAERAARAEAPRLIGREFAEGVKLSLSGARTLDELRQKATVYLATNHEQGESSLVGDGGFKGYILETDDGWYEALPGDPRSQLVLQELNKARQTLEQRGAVEAATARVNKAFDGIREWRQVGRQVRAERMEQSEQLHQQEVRAEAKIEADRRDAEKRGRELGVARKKDEIRAARAATGDKIAEDFDMVKPQPVEDVVRQKKSEAREPFTQKIDELNLRHQKALAQAEKRGVLSAEKRYDIDKLYATERNKLYADRTAAVNKVEAQVRAEYKTYEDVSVQQIESLIDFEAAENPKPHVFTPADDLKPEYAADIAGSNAEMMGKIRPPFQIDQYQLGDTVMQRIVFMTRQNNVMIVEDWDKSSGKLKRQTILKGDNLVIPDYENEGLGRLRAASRKRPGKSHYVFNDEIYADLGVINKEAVERDKHTSYVDGYGSYTRNLVRSGIGTLNDAADYAKHSYKAKKSEGFIALLTKGLIKGKKPKK